jgi:hypothetical protein
MTTARGIQQHPIFKLGKKPAKRDRRNLSLKSILRGPLRVPDEYDFDTSHIGVPTPVFGNDRVGDCVIAGRAHQTLRFELMEQRKVIRITDGEVVREYFLETGGEDNGLVVLDSLNRWRKRGWIAGGLRYFIAAFAEIDRGAQSQVKQAVFTELGVGLGLWLPTSAQSEFEAGKPWARVTGAGTTPGSWGGHYVYVTGYTSMGPTCVTWGRKQRMTWAFFDKYCDEAYAVIDALDTTKKRQTLNRSKIEHFLQTL